LEWKLVVTEEARVIQDVVPIGFEELDTVDRKTRHGTMLGMLRIEIRHQAALSAIAGAQVVHARTEQGARVDKAVLALLLRRVSKGSSEAMSALASRYATGDELPKDLAKAYKLYEASSRLGSADSTYNLALMTLFGEGIKCNREQAVALLKVASKGGSTDADLVLADALLTGKLGIKVSPSRAASFFALAAYRGDIRGLKGLVAAMEMHRLTAKQLTKALSKAVNS
jgi:TPR repeat protein